MAEIVNIGVNQIFPHPENPRKDLGDLTELVESIKVNRICFKDNQELDSLYYLLESLGYQLSDEELQMRRGSHPLFDEVPNDDD